MTEYQLSETVGDAVPPTMVTIRRENRRDGIEFSPWARVKVRKPARCVVDGCAIEVGAEAFRPLGNRRYRYERIAAAHVDQAAAS